MPSSTSRSLPGLRLALTALLLVAAPAVAEVAGSPAGTPSDEARTELTGLSPEVQAALAAGRVVLLETVADDTVLHTKVVAVIDAGTDVVVDEIRDYQKMSLLVPGLRSITYDRGADRDTFQVEVKPHPLLPLMELSKEVVIEREADGDAAVDIQLLSSSYERIEDQRSGWRLLRLDATSTLAIYETRERFKSLPFKNRVLSKMADGSQRLVCDVRSRCAERTEVARLAVLADGLAAAAFAAGL